MCIRDSVYRESRQSFGTLRAWGAVGFSLGIFLAGNVTDILGLDKIFWFYIISFAIAAVMLRSIRTAGCIKVFPKDFTTNW